VAVEITRQITQALLVHLAHLVKVVLAVMAGLPILAVEVVLVKRATQMVMDMVVMELYLLLLEHQ
jgi:hypothetical protein